MKAGTIGKGVFAKNVERFWKKMTCRRPTMTPEPVMGESDQWPEKKK
jgi:hypothetical protein